MRLFHILVSRIGLEECDMPEGTNSLGSDKNNSVVGELSATKKKFIFDTLRLFMTGDNGGEARVRDTTMNLILHDNINDDDVKTIENIIAGTDDVE